jgi:membrane associated rhomboid family serine protease
MDATPQNQPDGGKRPPQPPEPQAIFNIAPVVVALIAINFLVHLLRRYVLSEDADIDLLIETAFIPARYSFDDVGFSASWLTSPLTYGFLHGDWIHMGFNMVWLAVFGSPLAARIGPARFMIFYAGAVLASAATHTAFFWKDTALLIGASGGVSGVTGAAARYAFRVSREEGVRDFSGPLLPISAALRMPTVLAFCAVWLGVNFLTGAGILTPDGTGPIAWQAHVGGFLFGFLLAGIFDVWSRSLTAS